MNSGMKQILKITLVLFILSFSGATVLGRSDDLGQVGTMYAFALKELPQVLELMPVNYEDRYGFNHRDEFQRATLGIPYQEYALQTETPTGYWRVPVTVDGENRALLRLIRLDGEWNFAGFGGAGLARELGVLEKAVGRVKPTCGRIIRDFEMSCDYVQFDQVPGSKPEGLVIPMASAARVLLDLGNADSIDADGLPLWKVRKIRSTVLWFPAEKH